MKKFLTSQGFPIFVPISLDDAFLTMFFVDVYEIKSGSNYCLLRVGMLKPISFFIANQKRTINNRVKR